VTPVYPPGDVPGQVEDTLRELADGHDAARTTSFDRLELADLGQIAQNMPPAGARQLEQQFRSKRNRGDFGADVNGFLHLVPVRPGGGDVLYPVITFAYDWDRHVLRLRLALFKPVSSGGRRDLRAVGYRFETPECWESADDQAETNKDEHGGDHDFFHVQPICRLQKNLPRTQLPGLKWLNTTQPSFPVSASNGAGLLLVALIAIYGRDEIVRRQRASQLKALTSVARDLSWLQNRPVRPS
jgi:hypothetical protein